MPKNSTSHLALVRIMQLKVFPIFSFCLKIFHVMTVGGLGISSVVTRLVAWKSLHDSIITLTAALGNNFLCLLKLQAVNFLKHLSCISQECLQRSKHRKCLSQEGAFRSQNCDKEWP